MFRIVQKELARARARAPELVGRIGINLVGPTLLAHGTAEQQARWLPDILRADTLWCQLFSEPNAGSDLASRSTQATRADPDAGGPATGGEPGWLITGQKV